MGHWQVVQGCPLLPGDRGLDSGMIRTIQGPIWTCTNCAWPPTDAVYTTWLWRGSALHFNIERSTKGVGRMGGLELDLRGRVHWGWVYQMDTWEDAGHPTPANCIWVRQQLRVWWWCKCYRGWADHHLASQPHSTTYIAWATPSYFCGSRREWFSAPTLPIVKIGGTQRQLLFWSGPCTSLTGSRNEFDPRPISQTKLAEGKLCSSLQPLQTRG